MRYHEYRIINSKKDMRSLAKYLGVNSEWHEPDEQGVTAKVLNNGNQLDNAMGVGRFSREPIVVIYKYGEEVAKINLADLLSFASE